MSEKVSNPFRVSDDAEAYQRFRPRYHDKPCAAIAARIGTRADLKAVDVACGTGHSTTALAKYFPNVVGIDVSLEMLNVARRDSALEFIEAEATRLPFADNSLDLLTVFMAFHWLDQEMFLAEARRVLKPGSYLALDNAGFAGVMVNKPEFKEFHSRFYKENFPPVLRGRNQPEDEVMARCGFKTIEVAKYSQVFEMNLSEFVGYLLTQSNLIDSKKFAREELPAFLTKAYAPFFGDRRQPLEIIGAVKISKTGSP